VLEFLSDEEAGDLRAGAVLPDEVYVCNFHTGVVSSSRLHLMWSGLPGDSGHRELLGAAGVGLAGAPW